VVEFKQIIGAERHNPRAYGKYFFTIMDFRNATKLFADPDFERPTPQDELGRATLSTTGRRKRWRRRGRAQKIFHVRDVEVSVLSGTSVLRELDGTLITGVHPGLHHPANASRAKVRIVNDFPSDWTDRARSSCAAQAPAPGRALRTRLS